MHPTPPHLPQLQAGVCASPSPAAFVLPYKVLLKRRFQLGWETSSPRRQPSFSEGENFLVWAGSSPAAQLERT